LIVYANHPSWWDPLLAHYLTLKLFSPRQFYAPIDASALEKYKVFSKLGFYGVSLSSHSGAAAFLKQSVSILEHPATALWITPEGRFCDSRDHSAQLMPGLAHLCTKLSCGIALPIAIEYVFWEERLPECLVRFGDPVSFAEFRGNSKAEWTATLSTHLRAAQTELGVEVISRDASKFRSVLRGTAGAGGTYDLMRRIKSIFTRRDFRPEHGEKLH
jgi:1-acyl-sn-glycerol-3-phosphate acyltransferase